MLSAVLLAVAAGGTWAIGMTAAKPALRYIDPLSYMLGRWVLVAVLSLLYALATGNLAFSNVPAIALAVAAGFIDATLGGLFYLLAMQRTPAYQTTTLSSAAPFWGVAFAILLLGEPLRWEVFVAALLVVGGAFFLVGGRLALFSHLAGSLFALLASLLWGFAETVPSKLALEGGLNPETLLFVFACTAVATISILTFWLRPRFPLRVQRRGIALTVLAGAGGAFLGWVLWLSSLELAPASLISPIRGSTLVFSLIYSILFLRERITLRALWGALLVLGGVLLVSLR